MSSVKFLLEVLLLSFDSETVVRNEQSLGDVFAD